MKHNCILDSATLLSKGKLITSKTEKGVQIQHFLLKEQDKHDYFTLSFDDKVFYQENKVLEKVFSKILKQFLLKYHHGGTILIIGLGDSNILGDSFGPRVLDKLIATNQYNDFLLIPKVALFTPETMNRTGISSFKLIEMVVSSLHPDLIILIDSYVTTNKNYLNRLLEINDHGIIFAESLRSNRKIDASTFHIPVISIGYPILLKTKDFYLEHFKLNEDLPIMCNIISSAINKIIMS